MPRRRATIAAAAVFAIGAAFAADPTSLRADWGEYSRQHQVPWSPGTGSLMSAHDSRQQLAEPPR
jgi:hypothetical protein